MLVDVDTLDRLICGLAKLKDAGGLAPKSDFFWFTGSSASCSRDDDQSDTQEAIKQYQDLALQIKRASNALDLLNKSLARQLSALHKSKYPIYLQNGVANLPDELLEEILVLSGCRPTMLRTVSHRFNRLVMGLPRLWAAQDLFVDETHYIKLVLEQSRDQLLNVVIPAELRPVEALESLGTHWRRVKTLRYERQRRFRQNPAADVNEYLARLNLPELRHLIISAIGYPELLDVGDPVIWPTSDEITFTERWNATKLTDLHLENIIPQGIPGSDLLRCSIELDEPRWRNATDVQRLSRLIGYHTGPSLLLQELNLRFCDTRFKDTEFPKVVLENLKSFKFDVFVESQGSYDPSFPAVHNVVKGLIMPKVEQVTLETEFESTDHFLDFFYVFFSLDLRYASATTCRVTIKQTVMSETVMDIIFHQFPKLQHCFIEAGDVALIVYDHPATRVYPIPPLKTLVFRRCYRTLSGDFYNHLELIRKWRVQNGASTSNQANPELVVTFDRCSHFDRRVLDFSRRPGGVRVVCRD